MIDPTTTRMTADEFYRLPESNQLTELIDGEVIMSPAPELAHQDAVFNLALLIRQLAPGGKVRVAPVDVYLDEANSLQPDVLWTSADSRCVEEDGKRLRAAPELIVEVLSPGTAFRDRGEKFRLYEKHGVREYWMVDPTAQYLEVWHWQDGRFVRQGIYGPGETFASAVLGGAVVDLNAIFAT